MEQQKTETRSITAEQRKRVEEVCFRSLALIGRNCEYLEQHFDRTGADESTRQAVADIDTAAIQLDRTLTEAITLLEFLREDTKPQLYPIDLCELLQQVAAQSDMIRAQLGGGYPAGLRRVYCLLRNGRPQRCGAAVPASALQCIARQPGGRQRLHCAAPHRERLAADRHRRWLRSAR